MSTTVDAEYGIKNYTWLLKGLGKESFWHVRHSPQCRGSNNPCSCKAKEIDFILKDLWGDQRFHPSNADILKALILTPKYMKHGSTCDFQTGEGYCNCGMVETKTVLVCFLAKVKSYKTGE